MHTPPPRTRGDISLPPSVNTRKEEPKRANAESRTASSRVFQNRPPFPLPQDCMRVRMCGESLPVEAGRGGGPQAESLEPRFLPPEPPNKSQVPALPFLQPCCWTGTLSFPSSSIYWLNAPHTHTTLSSSLGKSPPSLRPSRFPMKSPQVMRFPMF